MDTQADEAEGTAESHTAAHDAERRLAVAMRAGAFPGFVPDTAELDRPTSSARLGRYAVLRELGRGGMGVVYACYDEQLDRKLAVKLLGGRYKTNVAHARLEREAQALARLSHPNVVQIHDVGDHHGNLFVAMEFIDGQTLRKWMSVDGRPRD